MTKREMIQTLVEILRENGKSKPVAIPRQTFTITGSDGSYKNFYIKAKDRLYTYSYTDVENIINAFIDLIKECIRQGVPLKIFGFGTFELNYRKPRKTRSIETGEDVDVPGRYVPRFRFGEELRTCARLYQLSVDDSLLNYDVDAPLDDDDYTDDMLDEERVKNNKGYFDISEADEE